MALSLGHAQLIISLCACSHALIERCPLSYRLESDYIAKIGIIKLAVNTKKCHDTTNQSEESVGTVCAALRQANGLVGPPIVYYIMTLYTSQ